MAKWSALADYNFQHHMPNVKYYMIVLSEIFQKVRIKYHIDMNLINSFNIDCVHTRNYKHKRL